MHQNQNLKVLSRSLAAARPQATAAASRSAARNFLSITRIQTSRRSDRSWLLSWAVDGALGDAPTRAGGKGRAGVGQRHGRGVGGRVPFISGNGYAAIRCT